MKKRIFLLNSFLFFSIILIACYSCGIDRLKDRQGAKYISIKTTSDTSATTTITTNSNIVNNNNTTACSCSNEFSPVCGNDKKDYDNACIAKCFGNSAYTNGHCICSEETIVCGKDGIDHTECQARDSKVEIIKYIPCDANEL